MSPERFAFVTPHVQKYAAAQTTPARQLAAVAATLKAGAWSDGTFAGETEYLPGHYQGRLQRFLAGKQLVGSDEHYAATFALMASRIGFPARVVLGAVTPTDGVVKGKDVVAWVELQTDAGWVTVDRTAYIPDRTKHPDDNPPDPVSNSQALDVPPPNPAQPPANLATRQAGRHLAAREVRPMAAGAVLRVESLAALCLRLGVDAIPLRFTLRGNRVAGGQGANNHRSCKCQSRDCELHVTSPVQGQVGVKQDFPSY